MGFLMLIAIFVVCGYAVAKRSRSIGPHIDVPTIEEE